MPAGKLSLDFLHITQLQLMYFYFLYLKHNLIELYVNITALASVQEILKICLIFIMRIDL